MKEVITMTIAEWYKTKHSPITWITFLAFGLAPIMGGLFMLLLSDPDFAQMEGALQMKARAMGVKAEWNSLLRVLAQAEGVGGILIFGFVISWIFGREYSDATIKDLLALPVQRSVIVTSKFLFYTIWCVLLSAFNLLLGLLIGFVLHLPAFSTETILIHSKVYAITALLTIAVNTPVALMAMIGKGYLAPLGFVALMLVISQIIGAVGVGQYFPWAIPALYAGTAGESAAHLPAISYIILLTVSVAGLAATIGWFRWSDQASS